MLNKLETYQECFSLPANTTSLRKIDKCYHMNWGGQKTSSISVPCCSTPWTELLILTPSSQKGMQGKTSMDQLYLQQKGWAKHHRNPDNADICWGIAHSFFLKAFGCWGLNQHPVSHWWLRSHALAKEKCPSSSFPSSFHILLWMQSAQHHSRHLGSSEAIQLHNRTKSPYLSQFSTFALREQ